MAKPVGLITADEIAMAGAVNGSLNRLFYLYTDQAYWTMSPNDFDFSYINAGVWGFNANGFLYGWNYVAADFGVRPVINLSKDTEIESGVGTATDPYVIKTTA